MYCKSILALSLTALSVANVLPTLECPLLGPVLPHNFDITKTDTFQNAINQFPAVIEQLFESGIINRTNSSFAIDVYSTTTNASIFSYNHDAENLHEYLTAGVLDDGTIMRIGSVSKLFTVYAILVKAGGTAILEEPVTRYLPELAGNQGSDPMERIIWEDITIGALASQQGGVGGFGKYLETLGCFSTQTCDNEVFLSYMRDHKPPAMPAFKDPIYADSGFGILGRVLERMSNSSIDEAIRTILGEPLGLDSTSTIEPESEGLNALIMPGDVTTSSSGGVYSSNADMRTLGLSILHSRLLSSAATRHWMKPQGNTASLSSPVGAPWEIERLPLNVTAESTQYRISDLYTKAGGQSGYSTIFALSPDHGIGFTINIGSITATTDRWYLRNAVGSVFLSAAEAAGAENAAQNFAGFFTDETQEANLTLTIDTDKPGLGIESAYVNGSEIRPIILGPAAAGLQIPLVGLSVRLYPTGLNSGNKMLFRAVPQLHPIEPRASIEGGQGIFDEGCRTWASAAFLPDYDSFVLEFVEGRLQSITSVVLGVTWTRSS